MLRHFLLCLSSLICFTKEPPFSFPRFNILEEKRKTKQFLSERSNNKNIDRTMSSTLTQEELIQYAEAFELYSIDPVVEDDGEGDDDYRRGGGDDNGGGEDGEEGGHGGGSRGGNHSRQHDDDNGDGSFNNKHQQGPKVPHILLTHLPLVLQAIGKVVPAARIDALKDMKLREGNEIYLTFEEFISLIGGNEGPKGPGGKTVEAEIEAGFLAREEALRDAFSLFDIGQTGFILVSDARKVMGEVMSDAEFDTIVTALTSTSSKSKAKAGQDDSNSSNSNSDGDQPSKISVEALVKFFVQH